jgi:hypothetical protein
MSSCTEFASEDLEEEHTLSGIVRNKDNVLCTLKDKAAYNGYAGIELRGRSSQRYPKKQFSFEFRDSIATENGIDLSPLNLPAEEDWVLGAPYVDRSLMRDALAFDMYMDQGYWAPKMQFIELFVMEGDRSRSHVNYNKHYKGIYVLKEKIKRGSNRVNISKMNETDISGGYLLVLSSSSHDGMLSTGEPPKEKVLDQGPARVSYVYPKKPTQSQQSYISQYLEDFQQALWSSNFNDPINGYAKYIDVPSWIDYFLHTEMTKNLDGYISSVYLHKDKGGKLVAGPGKQKRNNKQSLSLSLSLCVLPSNSLSLIYIYGTFSLGLQLSVWPGHLLELVLCGAMGLHIHRAKPEILFADGALVLQAVAGPKLHTKAEEKVPGVEANCVD